METDESDDLFKVGKPDEQSILSILGQRSYIDDNLFLAKSWDALCTKVERMLDVCDYRNLSISAAKRSWEVGRSTALDIEYPGRTRGSPERPPISGRPTLTNDTEGHTIFSGKLELL